MREFKFFALMGILLLAGVQSQAWMLFEPFIGYNKGQEQTSTLQGIGIGARLGIDFKDLFIAADFDTLDLQQGATTSVKYTDIGVTIGGQLQHLRVWYGIITGSQFSYPSGAVTITNSGAGSKIGIGGDLSGKLNLNLELRSLNYTLNDPGTGVTSPIAEVATIGFLSLSWIL